MCRVSRGILVSIVVTLLFALVAVAVCGGLEFWYHEKASVVGVKVLDYRIGLWRYCMYALGRDSCVTRKNILKFESGILKFEQDLDIAIIGLCVSALLIVISLVVGIALACSRNPSKYSTVWLAVLALLSGLCFLFPAVWLMVRVKENRRASWCFYIDFGGSGLCFVASLLSIILACCCRGSYNSASRDDEIVMLTR